MSERRLVLLGCCLLFGGALVADIAAAPMMGFALSGFGAGLLYSLGRDQK